MFKAINVVTNTNLGVPYQNNGVLVPKTLFYLLRTVYQTPFPAASSLLQVGGFLA